MLQRLAGHRPPATGLPRAATASWEIFSAINVANLDGIRAEEGGLSLWEEVLPEKEAAFRPQSLPGLHMMWGGKFT